jgi:membrane protein insertase Oxa1/YidC/SpoIIIJ
MMPVLMGVVFYNFSSGLNLYFVVFYSLSAFSQWKVSKDVKMVS